MQNETNTEKKTRKKSKLTPCISAWEMASICQLLFFVVVPENSQESHSLCRFHCLWAPRQPMRLMNNANENQPTAWHRSGYVSQTKNVFLTDGFNRSPCCVNKSSSMLKESSDFWSYGQCYCKYFCIASISGCLVSICCFVFFS